MIAQATGNGPNGRLHLDDLVKNLLFTDSRGLSHGLVRSGSAAAAAMAALTAWTYATVAICVWFWLCPWPSRRMFGHRVECSEFLRQDVFFFFPIMLLIH
jgi:hypothetical protein